jgi:hypothetical protein
MDIGGFKCSKTSPGRSCTVVSDFVGTDTLTLSLSFLYTDGYCGMGRGDESTSEFGSAGLEQATSDYRSRHLAILQTSLFCRTSKNSQSGGRPTVTAPLGLSQLDWTAISLRQVTVHVPKLVSGLGFGVLTSLAEDNGLLACNIVCCSEISRRFGLHIAAREEPG